MTSCGDLLMLPFFCIPQGRHRNRVGSNRQLPPGGLPIVTASSLNLRCPLAISAPNKS
jgi:hypothetical protein